MLTDYKLGDFFPDWAAGGGIFAALDNDGAPWADDVDPDLLDLAYFGNHSGDKPPSPLVSKLADDGEITAAGRAKLARILLATNSPNWARLYATLSVSYNALTPTTMTETLTGDETVKVYGKTRTRTDNLTHGVMGTETRTPNLTTTDAGTGSETRTPNTTITETPNTTETRNTGIYGFNSASASNSDTVSTQRTGTTTTTETGTETTATTNGNTRTETGTEQKSTNRTETDTGTITNNDGGRDTVTRGYTRTRTGNDGRRTAAQILMEDRESWLWNFFYDVVFPAVDHLLTLPIYGSECYCPIHTGWITIRKD